MLGKIWTYSPNGGLMLTTTSFSKSKYHIHLLNQLPQHSERTTFSPHFASPVGICWENLPQKRNWWLLRNFWSINSSKVPWFHEIINQSQLPRSFNIIIQANVYKKQNLTSPLYSNTISKKFAVVCQPKKKTKRSLQGQRFHSLNYPKSSSHSWLEHPHVHRKYIFNQGPFSSQLCELIPECMTA